jgi:hypothetical protein
MQNIRADMGMNLLSSLRFIGQKIFPSLAKKLSAAAADTSTSGFSGVIVAGLGLLGLLELFCSKFVILMWFHLHKKKTWEKLPRKPRVPISLIVSKINLGKFNMSALFLSILT